MVYEDEIEKIIPDGSNLIFHVKPQGWFEKMTLADEGWSVRRYLELSIVKIEEKIGENIPIIYDKMTEELWRKLTSEQGNTLREKIYEMNQKHTTIPKDFPKANRKEK